MLLQPPAPLVVLRMNTFQFLSTIVTLLIERPHITRCDDVCARSRFFQRKAESKFHHCHFSNRVFDTVS